MIELSFKIFIFTFSISASIVMIFGTALLIKTMYQDWNKIK